MATQSLTTLTSQGSVLTTELNALADGSYSALGSTVFDNTATLALFGIAQLTVTYGSAPNVNSAISLFGVVTLDGTNYEDGSSSLRYPDDSFADVFQVYNNTSLQRLFTKPFRLKPAKYKFGALNSTGQSFSASGHVVTLWTFGYTIA